MIGRRRLLVASAASALVAPWIAAAQHPRKIARIGVLIPHNRTFFMNRFAAFREGMRELGYVEDKNLAFEYRYADGNLERLPELAAELVALKVDLIFSASAEVIIAAQKATKTIPIVFGTVQDPVASGIVTSLARPGGNTTGLSALAPDLGQKRLELLKELVPGLTKVAFLWSPAEPGSAASLKAMQRAAQILQLQLVSLDVPARRDVERALERARQQGVQAMITNPDPAINGEQMRIVTFAAFNRLPTMYAAPEAMEAGGLINYAPNYTALWRRAATYADKVLKGAKPADLPIEQPTKFDLIVNLQTAKALGITVPPTILVRADRVIE